MNLSNILKELDAQISQLQQARDALASLGSGMRARQAVGRRNISAAARARIAAAQKKRWAKWRKSQKAA